MGSPPGPVAGGAPRVWRASPVHRLCHAVAPRHSHRVVELAQRMRLPPRCRHPPPLHICHGGRGRGGGEGSGGKGGAILPPLRHRRLHPLDHPRHRALPPVVVPPPGSPCSACPACRPPFYALVGSVVFTWRFGVTETRPRAERQKPARRHGCAALQCPSTCKQKPHSVFDSWTRDTVREHFGNHEDQSRPPTG